MSPVFSFISSTSTGIPFVPRVKPEQVPLLSCGSVIISKTWMVRVLLFAMPIVYPRFQYFLFRDKVPGTASLTHSQTEFPSHCLRHKRTLQKVEQFPTHWQ